MPPRLAWWGLTSRHTVSTTQAGAVRVLLQPVRAPRLFCTKRLLTAAFSTSSVAMAKRKALSDASREDSIKRTKIQEADFPDWPAPKEQIEAARAFIRECVEGQESVLVVPDKDGSHSLPVQRRHDTDIENQRTA